MSCEREACSACGSSTYREAHFTRGVTICAACWALIRTKAKTPADAQTPQQREVSAPQGHPSSTREVRT